MFKPYTESTDKTVASMKSLYSMNVGTLEELAKQQTELFTGLISDSINYADSLGKQSEVKGWYNVNQAYTESVRARVLKSVKETYSTLTQANAETTKLMSTTAPASEGKKPVSKAKPAAPAKKATSGTATQPKAASKAAPKPAAKPATKSAAKAAVKADPAPAPVEKAVELAEKAPAAAKPKTSTTRKPRATTKKTPAKSATTSTQTKA